MRFILPFIVFSSAFTAITAAHAGDGTYYATGLGSCGITNNDNDLIAAVSHELYDTYPGATANPNKNPICGRKIKATYKGKSVVVKVTDRCGGCAGKYDLDFSPAAFKKLANPSAGRIKIKWDFANGGKQRREILERRIPPEARNLVYRRSVFEESD